MAEKKEDPFPSLFERDPVQAVLGVIEAFSAGFQGEKSTFLSSFDQDRKDQLLRTKSKFDAARETITLVKNTIQLANTLRGKVRKDFIAAAIKNAPSKATAEMIQKFSLGKTQPELMLTRANTATKIAGMGLQFAGGRIGSEGTEPKGTTEKILTQFSPDQILAVNRGLSEQNPSKFTQDEEAVFADPTQQGLIMNTVNRTSGGRTTTEQQAFGLEEAKTAGRTAGGQTALSPGQILLDGEGNEIARAPANRRTSIVKRLLPDGKVNTFLVDMDSGVTLRNFGSGINVRFQPSGDPTGLTTAGKTKTQQTVKASRELLTNLGTLSKKLEGGGASVVGPVGALLGFVNKTFANFNPDLFSVDRSRFEGFTKITRQSALRVVSDESRFTENDRDFIFDLFPSTGPFDSPENASVKLQVMTAFFLRRLGGDLSALGIDAADVPTLSPEGIVDFIRNGLLTEDEGAASLKALFPEQFRD